MNSTSAGSVGNRLFTAAYKRVRRIAKRLRCYYYFGNSRSLVHGPIRVGKRANIQIGANCSINQGVLIQGHTSVRIGDGVVLSPNVMILDAGLDFDSLRQHGERIHRGKPVEIGSRCWIGAGAIILPGVTLGPSVMVGAGSVVTRSYPANSVVGGNPAVLLRSLDEST